MHLPDGIVTQSAPILALNAAGAVISAVTMGRAFRDRVGAVAWTGTLAAFVLAAQTLNVPIWLGTSAHCIGAGLLTLTLGPAAAVTCLSAVLLVQALLFGDGGISVLGINAVNIALIPVLAVYCAERMFGPERRALVSVLGVTLGNAISAASLSGVLIVGAHAPPAATFAWLIGLQTLAGVAEGILTALSVRWLARRAPEIFQSREERLSVSSGSRQRRFRVAALGILCAALGVAVATGGLPIASRAPDALERAVEHLVAR